MRGQWLGNFDGDATGNIMANVDELGATYAGVAFITDPAPGSPRIAAVFDTVGKADKLKFKAVLLPINPTTGNPDRWENVKQYYPSITEFPIEAEVVASWNAKTLSLAWVTNLGAKGKAILPASKADTPSELKPHDFTWSQYKNYVLDQEGKRFLFRGQSDRWRLRTTFHRSGRANLGRFRAEDVPALHRKLSAKTRHVFNLDIGNENGAFLSLIQHHGYPTPLLDWTYSPYVAVFFAFRKITRLKAQKAEKDRCVRIYMFDQARWRVEWVQSVLLDPGYPHLSMGEFLAIENERMVPQQAATTVTNLDDVESYIREKEIASGKTYLSAIDISVLERDDIVNELRYMGITAGSLFPGIDGTCEELREQNFEL